MCASSMVYVCIWHGVCVNLAWCMCASSLVYESASCSSHGSIHVHLAVCGGSLLVEGCVHLVWCVYLYV